MDKETLLWAREEIIKVLNNPEKASIDTLELIINLNRLLDPENYEHDIKVLKLGGKKNGNNEL